MGGWNHQLVLGRSCGVLEPTIQASWEEKRNGGIMDDLLFGGVRLHY